MHRDDWFRYYPISDADRRWGIYVTCGGYVHVPPDRPYPPSDHPRDYAFDYERGRTLDEYQLHFITRGEGTMEWGAPRQSVHIDSGDAFLLFPGVWHRYRPEPGTGWDEYWVGFAGEHAARIMRPPFFAEDEPHIPVAHTDAMLDEFTEVVSRMHSTTPALQQMLGSMTMVLLARLQMERVITDVGGSPAAEQIHQAKRRIAELATGEFSGHALAEEMGVDYEWLRRAFKRHTGFSLNQYHVELRVQRAIELLETTALPIGELALRVGYADPFHFSRVFKKVTGQSPAHWRKRRDRMLGGS
ncbi:MAG: helix-turn-helix domain-containing protein [bacterium]